MSPVRMERAAPLALALAMAAAPRLAAGFSLLTDPTNPPEAEVASILASARRWPAAERFGSTAGLGGGIAYAIDPLFCEEMLPRFWAEQDAMAWDRLDPTAPEGRAGCEQLVGAIERAMATWSLNHPHLKFTPDNSPCAGERGCEPTELLISTFSEGARDLLPPGAEPVDAIAFAHVERFSHAPARTLMATAGPNGTLVPGEAHGVRLESVSLRFDSDVCWYLDSAACAPLNRWRLVDEEGPAMTATVILGLSWALIAMWLFSSLVRALVGGGGCAVGACGAAPTDEAPLAREALEWSERALLAFSRVHAARLCVALCVLLSSAIVWQSMIVPCVRCYDFEAAVAHEIGHALGVGHTTQAPTLVLNEPAEHAREDVACARALEGALHVGSHQGPRAAADSPSEPPLMASVHQFPAYPCIGQDDLDALNTLYPSCDPQANLGPPVCVPRPRQPLGLERAKSLLALPLALCVGLVALLTRILRRRAKSLLARVEQQRQRFQALQSSVLGQDLLVEPDEASLVELGSSADTDTDRDGADAHAKGWQGWLERQRATAGAMLGWWMPAHAGESEADARPRDGGGLPAKPSPLPPGRQRSAGLSARWLRVASPRATGRGYGGYSSAAGTTAGSSSSVSTVSSSTASPVPSLSRCSTSLPGIAAAAGGRSVIGGGITPSPRVPSKLRPSRSDSY